jgi:raffinose/stachyose/melibiose transport system substrate-binding protein
VEAAPAEATEAPAVVEEPAPAAGEPVKIVWWMLGDDIASRDMLQEEFVDTFNAAHDDIELEMIFQDNVMDVAQTAVQAGSGPDVVFTNLARSTELIKADLLLPLDDYAEQYGWADDILPWAFEMGSYNGTLYTLPIHHATMILLYNDTVMKENGWEPPKSRAELEAICEEATTQGLICLSQSNQFWHGVNEWLMSAFLNNYAGSDKVYEALVQERQWDDPVFVEAVELLKQYSDNGWLSGGLENYYSLTWDDVVYATSQGEAVMEITGTWEFKLVPSYFDEAGQEWNWSQLPSLRDGVTPGYDMALGGAMGINVNTPNPDAAAATLDWMVNDTARAAKIVQQYDFGEWVVPLKYTESDFAGTDERLLRAVVTVDEAAAAGMIGYTPWTFMPARTDQYLIEELDAVLSGTITAQEYLQEMQRIYAEEFAEGIRLPPQTNVTSP